MSRGHGRIQREILDLLAKGQRVDTIQLVLCAHMVPLNGVPTKAQYISVARALRKLEQEGLIVRGPRVRNHFDESRIMWMTPERAAQEQARDRDRKIKGLVRVLMERPDLGLLVLEQIEKQGLCHEAFLKHLTAAKQARWGRLDPHESALA
jgi:hypothetical protein